MNRVFSQFVLDKLDVDPSKALPFSVLLRELRSATGLAVSRDEAIVAVSGRSDLALQVVGDKLVVSGASLRA